MKLSILAVWQCWHPNILKLANVIWFIEQREYCLADRLWVASGQGDHLKHNSDREPPGCPDADDVSDPWERWGGVQGSVQKMEIQVPNKL